MDYLFNLVKDKQYNYFTEKYLMYLYTLILSFIK